MKNKILFIIACILFSILSVNAENKMFKKKFTTKETPALLSKDSSNGRSAFFKEGVVTTIKESADSYSLYYYDMKGELKKKKELPEVYLVYYMVEHNNELYMILLKDVEKIGLTSSISTKCYLYQLDEDLNIIKTIFINNNYPDFEDTANRSAHGWEILTFEEEKIIIYLHTLNMSADDEYNIYMTDYNLKNIALINNTSEYNNYLKKCIDNQKKKLYEIEDGKIEINFDYNIQEEDTYNYNTNACLKIIKTNNEGKEIFNKLIEEKEYFRFYSVRKVDDYIVTIAAKDFDSIMGPNGALVSDILVYDLNGELLQTIPIGDKYANYFNAIENKILVGIQEYDGICDNDKYNSNDGCDIITNVAVYELSESEQETDKKDTGNVSSGNDKVKNPETSIFSSNGIPIICLVILGIGMIIIGIKAYKRVKYLK